MRGGDTIPISEEAAAGLRAAVEWNPTAARYLMDILRGLPIGVRYKEQDRYGPLSIMLNAMQPVKWITKDVSVPVHIEPLPAEKLQLCEVFNSKWLERRFTKQELADAIEQILLEVEPRPMLETVDSHSVLVFKASGTYLRSSNDDHLGEYRKI